MSVEPDSDLASFHRFVAQQLEEGDSHLTPEEVLARWRERADTIEAVREGIDAVDAGRTQPLDTFAEDFQRRHGISDDS